LGIVVLISQIFIQGREVSLIIICSKVCLLRWMVLFEKMIMLFLHYYINYLITVNFKFHAIKTTFFLVSYLVDNIYDL